MTNIITSLLRGISKNRALINSHVGQRGADVHPDGDYRDSGFMNPTEKYMANNKVIVVPDETDIFALSSGRYGGRSFINKPEQADGSYAIVNIIDGENYRIIDYYWLNAKKIFHAYKSYGDDKPVWWDPILGRKQTLKNGAGGSVLMSVYRYDDNVRVILDIVANNLKLNPGGYIDIASVELFQFYPKSIGGTYGIVGTDGGVYFNCALQVTEGGNIRVINTNTSHVLGSALATVEYTIDIPGSLPNS